MRVITRLLNLGLALAISAMASTLSADELLYAEPIPSDAAFVRALGFAQSDAPNAFGVDLSLDGKFSVILNGEHADAKPEMVATQTPFGLIIHDIIADKSKVQVAFFNAGYPGNTALKTGDGRFEITTARPESASFREVNPLVISVAFFLEDAIIGEPFELRLIRGENPTIWLNADGSNHVIYSGVIWKE